MFAEFDFESFADFMGYFFKKLVKMFYQTKEWLDKTFGNGEDAAEEE